jgi:hypothetical protein
MKLLTGRRDSRIFFGSQSGFWNGLKGITHEESIFHGESMEKCRLGRLGASGRLEGQVPAAALRAGRSAGRESYAAGQSPIRSSVKASIHLCSRQWLSQGLGTGYRSPCPGRTVTGRLLKNRWNRRKPLNGKASKGSRPCIKPDRRFFRIWLRRTSFQLMRVSSAVRIPQNNPSTVAPKRPSSSCSRAAVTSLVASSTLKMLGAYSMRWFP